MSQKRKTTGTPKMPDPPPPQKINGAQPPLNEEKLPDMFRIMAKYEQLCSTPSDINELLPFLRAAADVCPHITEFGVRCPTSTYAFLAANPKTLISYDIARYQEVDEVESMAPNFKFIQGSTLDIDIEPTDLLFIDTFHSAEQLRRELAKHAVFVRKYIAFHDTTTYWEKAEPPYPGILPGLDVAQGLKYAIEPFLRNNPQWAPEFRVHLNNGLTVIRRVSW